MSIFTSDREKRLWTWTLLVVVAIYSTLGLARTLTGVLHDRNLLDNTFMFGFILIIIAIILQALKVRLGGAEIGVGLAIASTYLMVFLRMGIPEERTHLIEYSVVAIFIHEALMERLRNGHHVLSPAVLVVIMTALVDWLDEGIQTLLPNRVYDIIDVGFNALAGLMAVLASLALAWARRWTQQRRRSTSHLDQGGEDNNGRR